MKGGHEGGEGQEDRKRYGLLGQDESNRATQLALEQQLERCRRSANRSTYEYSVSVR